MIGTSLTSSAWGSEPASSSKSSYLVWIDECEPKNRSKGYMPTQLLQNRQGEPDIISIVYLINISYNFLVLVISWYSYIQRSGPFDAWTNSAKFRCSRRSDRI